MSARIDRIKIIEQAERFVKAGKLKEAIVEYERLSSTDPDDVGTLNVIGDLCIRTGQTERAVRSFIRVAEEYEKRGLYSQALAIRKKIYKITPNNLEYAQNLADLYGQQGFLSDAKAEYLKIAERYIKDNKLQDAIQVFEKAVRLDKDDFDLKKALAGLYREQGQIEAALDQLNEIAESQMAQGRLDAAEGILQEALTLKPAETRSLVNLVEIYRRQNLAPKAIALIEANLTIDPGNVQLLNLLGNFYFDSGDIKKAEDVFMSIINGHPMNVNARIKLGRIEILKDKLDQAFELFEPLINSLLKKHKDEKAIGLIGLILESQKPHLPALECLASIYRANKEEKKLEVVVRAMLDELRRQGAKDKMMPLLTELRQLRPEDPGIADEAKAVRRDLGLPLDEGQPGANDLSEKDKLAVDETLAQADLYMQQGLVRNARRILENIRFRYPDNSQIMKKIAVLEEIRTHIDEEELRRRVEKATAMESKVKDKVTQDRHAEERRRGVGSFGSEAVEGDKISTADIFAETDIIPFINIETGELKFYELKDQVADELRMLRTAFEQQTQGELTQLERDLSNIVADFKNDFKTKIDHPTSDTHYQLGLAFMDQGLYADAIDELTLASKDKNLAMDAFTAMSHCYRQKRSFQDAEKWLKKALALAKEGSDQYFALEFEMAELWEQAENKDKALSLFKEVLSWNPGFRNITLRVDTLERQSNGQPQPA